MSLKAKIEAVIYASEEPVTLLQLVGLLGVEAQAELDRLDDRQATLAMESVAEAAGAEGPSLAGLNGEAEVSPFHPEAGQTDGPVEDVEPESAREGDVPSGAGSPAEKRQARERERKLREFFRELLDQLIRDYQTSDRGLEVREVAGGFRMGTKPEYHDAVRGFVRSLKPPLKLTLQALETLAVVAYKQPVTAPEVAEIRGVDSGGVLGSLMTRKLVTTAGRKQVIGRPILYKTTKDFLLRFGLKDVAELPSIEEFEKMASELAEQEEIPMANETQERSSEEAVTGAELAAEREAITPQADGTPYEQEPNDSNLGQNDMPALDGRQSTIPPNYDKPGDDPSADEAAIQAEGA